MDRATGATSQPGVRAGVEAKSAYTIATLIVALVINLA